jgi:DNA-binding transcriptional MerR regulator/effector-binding domain-containing protein
VGDLISIGDFSRASHLGVKTLRHYHEIGLLAPADIDPSSGYRYYSEAQIPTAQVIRRLRALQMPLAEIKAVLATPAADARNHIVAAHLDRLQSELRHTEAAVAELRELVERPPAARTIEHRSVAATSAIAVQEVISLEDAFIWWQGAMGELHAIATAQRLDRTGPPGGLFDGALWEHERGAATVYLPTISSAQAVGRVVSLTIPAAELAVVTHHGSLNSLDLAYGDLAAHVTRHEIGIVGPLREFYPVSTLDTDAPDRWETEIGWPIFRSDAAA